MAFSLGCHQPARVSTLTMKSQGLPPHHESPDMQKMQLHPDGGTAAGLTEITSQEHPAHSVSAFLHQNSLFWESPSFWELGRLLLNNLCHGTAGIHSAHVWDCGRPLPSPWITDIPGVAVGFSPPAASSPQAMHKHCHSPGPHRRSCLFQTFQSG